MINTPSPITTGVGKKLVDMEPPDWRSNSPLSISLAWYRSVDLYSQSCYSLFVTNISIVTTRPRFANIAWGFESFQKPGHITLNSVVQWF